MTDPLSPWVGRRLAGPPSFRAALEQAPDQADVRRAVLVYGHLLLSFGIVAVSVGLADAVADPRHTLIPGAAMTLDGGCALFLLTFAYTHWRIRRTFAWHCVGAGVACLIVLPLASRLPALAAVAVVTAIVAAMTAVEERRVLASPPAADRGPAHAG